MRSIYIGLFLLFTCAAYFSSFAQQLSINKLSDGISELDFIYDMRLDAKGDLLIATDHSLYLYDGFNFEPKHLQYELSAPFVTAIEQGEKSKLIGHYKGFVSHLDNSTSLDVKVKGKVVGVVSQANKHFVFTQDGECLELDQNYQLIQTIIVKSGLTVYDVLSHKDKIYLSSSDGLLVFDTDSQREFRLVSVLVEDKKVESIAVYDDQLFAVYDNVIHVSSTSDWSFKPINLSLVKGKIKTIVSSDNRLVVGSTVGVYDYFLQGNKAFISGYKEDHQNETFPITRLYLAPNGAIYVGTYGYGLWAIPSPTYYFIPNANLQNAKISSIHLFEKNTFVVGGQRGLSFYLNGELVNRLFPKASLLSNKQVNVIKKHPKGLIIGTELNGVWLLDTNRNLTQLVDKILSIEDIESDSLGNLWISTSFEGLYTYINGYVSHFSKLSSFSRNDLSKIKLKGNRLWFINGDDGFGYVNLEDSSLTIPSDLPPVKIIDFEVVSNHEIWAATQGDGIMNYNQTGYSFIDLLDVLGNNYTNSLTGDTNETLWLTNQNSLISWNRDDRVSASDLGLYFECTFRRGANYSIQEGSWIYYGTEEGLVYFDASQHYDSFGKEFSFTINYSFYEVAESAIQLSYEDKFVVDFKYNDLIRNPFLTFAYNIKGMQDEWVVIEGNKFTLNGVGYGDVDIQIRATSKSGVVYNFNQIQLNISKPFWLQLWFYLLIILFLASGVYLYTRFKVQQLRKRNIELKKLVALRTKEITQKNKKLEQFAYAVSHDLKNPVVNIIGLVEILEQLDIFKEEHSKQVFGMLGTSSRQLDRLVKGLMELLKVRKDEESTTDNSISEIFQEVKQTISLQIVKSNAEINEDFSAVSTIHFNRTYLYSIVYNLTSNAVKYRDPKRALKITISTYQKDGYIVLKIADNGLGMDLINSEGQLFKMFHRFHDHVEGTGVGLHLINEMVESSGGFIEVDSKVGEGSEFRIFLKE